MNGRLALSRQFINSLRDGHAPWRYPFNRLPAFEPLFGKFFTGEPRSETEANYDEVDGIIAASGAKIKHHGRCIFPRYLRDKDRIVLPPRSIFMNERQYQATRLHEVFHHIEQDHRYGYIGTPHQSELVAEIGTGMIESKLRLPHDRDNTNIKKWLPWWAMEVAWDYCYLFDAILWAGRAANYLLSHCLRKEVAVNPFPACELAR